MKKAILLVAWGASSLQGQHGLAAFENFCRLRFAGLTIRWAYTSPILRQRLILQKQKSDSVAKALMRLHYEKFNAVCIQPLQTIRGHEYEDVCASAMDTANRTGMRCEVGRPLLYGPEDSDAVATALLRHLPDGRMPMEDVVFMGHGATHPATVLYANLNESLSKKDSHVHLGTMSIRSGIKHLLPKLTSKKVWLMPLLSAIGKHALADMAGDKAESWRSRIQAGGHDCVPVLRGTAEYPAVAEIWLNNLDRVLQNIAG